MEQTLDLKALVKDYQKQFNETMKWNGFNDSEEGKKKWEQYKNSWRAWEEKTISELNLKEYLGEQAVSDLLFCLDNDEHILGLTFRVLVNTEDGNYALREREAVLENINKYKLEIIKK